MKSYKTASGQGKKGDGSEMEKEKNWKNESNNRIKGCDCSLLALKIVVLLGSRGSKFHTSPAHQRSINSSVGDHMGWHLVEEQNKTLFLWKILPYYCITGYKYTVIIQKVGTMKKDTQFNCKVKTLKIEKILPLVAVVGRCSSAVTSPLSPRSIAGWNACKSCWLELRRSWILTKTFLHTIQYRS